LGVIHWSLIIGNMTLSPLLLFFLLIRILMHDFMISQDEYKNEEEIGILQCRHEYHVDCIRRWLHEKNVCPLCKSKALTIG